MQRIRPFIEQKNVILCRSGIQIYARHELIAWGFKEEDLPDKEFFREYRPPQVLVKAKKLFENLPLVREHPDVWVTADNWNTLVGGYTGSDVEVIEQNGEVCLQSSLMFTNHDLHDYYLDGNKEVSVGYLAEREYKPCKQYDLILTAITDVNHLALTVAGRGGADVAVQDSLAKIFGGIRKMRTGILFNLLHRKASKDSEVKFSSTVFDALKQAEGKSGEDYEKVVSKVTDSLGDFMDSSEKNKLIDAVKDVFENPENSISVKDELAVTLDSMYERAKEKTVADGKACTDTDGKGANTNNIADSDDKKDDEKKEEDSEPSDKKEEDLEPEDKKDEDSKAEDSEPEDKKDEKKEDKKDETKDSTLDALAPMIEKMVTDAITKALGGNKEDKSGSTLDSVTTDFTDSDLDFLFKD